VEVGISVLYVPPDVTILDSGEDHFLATLPVPPGTDQLERVLTISVQRDSDPNCGIEAAPDQTLEVTDRDGFQHIFYRGYSQAVQEEHTFEQLFYWLSSDSYCFHLELALESAGIGSGGTPQSDFDRQGQIDFVETILSTYYEKG
jgi:hypothetical protein